MSEARDSQATVVTELVEHKQSVENSWIMFVNDLVETRKGMTAEKLSVMPQAEKLGKLDDGLHTLEERVAAVTRTAV